MLGPKMLVQHNGDDPGAEDVMEKSPCMGKRKFKFYLPKNFEKWRSQKLLTVSIPHSSGVIVATANQSSSLKGN
uniref:Uncharacterized protein n=1 Tax=Amphimedon queenslandica TaxID=400682 RepID=A0A1X7VXL8_AMPQE